MHHIFTLLKQIKVATTKLNYSRVKEKGKKKPSCKVSKARDIQVFFVWKIKIKNKTSNYY